MSAPLVDAGTVGEIAGSILDEVEKAVYGKRQALELVLMAILADGHILIEDLARVGQDSRCPFVRGGHRPRVRPGSVHP